MLRSLFRRQRTVRVPLEETPAGHQVREVKIYRRAISKPSNLVTTFFVAYFVFRLLDSYVGEDEKTRAKRTGSLEQWKKNQDLGPSIQQNTHRSDHWKKAHEAIQKSSPKTAAKSSLDASTELGNQPSDVISTITIPVWFRAKKGTLYQPGDEEFREYVRIQSDEKKMIDLKRQVARMATERLANPAHQMNLKHIGFQGEVHIALELVPQLFPPPVYEVPAIVLFKDGISYGWKELRPEIGSRLESVMRPSVAYAASKASVKAFFLASWAIAKAKIFGGHVAFGQSHPQGTVMTKKELEQDNDIPSASQWPTDAKAMQELVRAVHSSQNTRAVHSELLKTIPFSVAIQFAAATFRRRQLIGQAHMQQHRARGVIQVRGSLMCMGETGKYKTTVIAFYLPSEDKFLGPLVIGNAYIIKDFSAVERIHDRKKKQLLGRADEAHEEHVETPPAGKDEE